MTDTVLVVDDDRTIRMMLAMRLRAAGIDAEMAENGQVALAALAERRFDVVLLDVVMPELDGYGVLERIKQSAELRDVPVIMMSTLGEVDNVIRCLEAGAADYLPKPLDAHLLLARVNGILLRKRLRDLVDVASAVDLPGQLAQEFQRIAQIVAREQADH